MSLICAIFFTLSLFSSPFSAAGENAGDQRTQNFIVRIQDDLKPSAYLDVEDWYRSTLESISFNANQEGGEKSIDFLHVYRTVFHGFSARLTLDQAELLKSHPSVIGVFPDRILHTQTTRSPSFLGLDSYHNPTGLLKESDLGSNVVIGVLDTGIWPESPSFNDEGLGPVPAHFKGVCDGGVDFPSTLCNKKIVGARYFSNGVKAMMMKSDPPSEIEPESARDFEGHGTHTASTAAGRQVANTSFFGYAKGEVTGIAPKARLAIYKVCWKRECASSDILAGFDRAVQDGVDVISLSAGGAPQRYSRDAIAMGAFGAVEKGVFVSASGGNDGPNVGTVSNGAPWITTVGASTIDRTFPSDLVLGNGVVLTGTSVYSGKPFGKNEYFPIYAGNLAEQLCTVGLLEPKKVRGKIVICSRGQIGRVEKGLNVKNAGGVGVVIANNESTGESLSSDAHVIPGLSITKSSRDKLLSYLNSTRDPKATIVFHGTKLGSGPAPAVAGFSSRGPNLESSYLLKPDVIAPGVDIIAAWPSEVSPSGLDEDTRRSGYNIISGTSMSCPHVSGIAALIKGAHPDWSPAMIRSALMTTSYNRYTNGKPLLKQESNTEASVWDTGVGHVRPEKANDPGLTFDLGVDDYVGFLCASNYSESEIRTIIRRDVSCAKSVLKQWDLNYPAIVVDSGKKGLTVTRSLTNVDSAASSYSAVVASPKGANVIVNPVKLSFKAKGEKQSFKVKVSSVNHTSGNSEVGWLTWTDGNHNVTIPLIVL